LKDSGRTKLIAEVFV